MEKYSLVPTDLSKKDEDHYCDFNFPSESLVPQHINYLFYPEFLVRSFCMLTSADL